MTKQTSKKRRTTTAKKKTATKIKNTIVFDLETTTLIPKIENEDEAEKRKEIKKLRISVLCCFDYDSKEYSFYTEKNIKDFLERVKTVDKIVGYNILGFDYLVLEKYGFETPPKDKSVDIFDIIRTDTGEWISLDALSRANLGRGKLVKGKDMVGADIVTVFDGCKGDVLSTKELFELHLQEKLKYKHLKGRKPHKFFVDDDYVEVGDGDGYIPPDIKCPKCGGNNFEKFDELREGMGVDEMTEGQFAEYMAGTWGTLECLDCGETVDYEV